MAKRLKIQTPKVLNRITAVEIVAFAALEALRSVIMVVVVVEVPVVLVAVIVEVHLLHSIGHRVSASSFLLAIMLVHCEAGIPSAPGLPHDSSSTCSPKQFPVVYVLVVTVVFVVVIVVAVVLVADVAVVVVVVVVAVVVVSMQSVAPSPFPSPPRVSRPGGQSMHGVPEKSSWSYWLGWHFRHDVAASFVW